jgi:hypothetical protein
MLALLSPLFGIMGSLLPSVVRIFERRQELKHEIDLTRIKIEAAEKNAKIELEATAIKADVDEGESVRRHDRSLRGGQFIDTLRASIRPVITYVFFFFFIAVKTAAAYVMLKSGQSVPEMLKAVWDVETMSLFATIIAFWFGARTLEKMETRSEKLKNITVTNNTKKKP